MRTSFLLFLLSVFISCSKPQQVDLLITNVSIVDVESGKTIPEQLIAISGNRILATDNSSNASHYAADSVISAEGKFAMPGLWDNHVHFRGGEKLIQQNKAMLPLYLAHGVTTVRDAGGDITPSIQQWNSDIQEGRLAGPTIYTSGPKFDGSRPSWDGSFKIVEDADISPAFYSLDSIHADFVKIYDGNLSPEMYYSIIKEASKRGYKVTGHMPLSSDLMKAVELGLDGNEHLYYILTKTSPLGDSLREANAGYGMISKLMDTYDTELATETYQKLAEADFYVTPTLHIGKVLGELNITDHTSDPLLSYIAPEIVETYQGRIRSATRGGEHYTLQRDRWETGFQRMVKPMYDAGIHVLAGSDCGAFNSYTYPGESIHKELERLVAAGLTPREALETSIINGPRFFDASNEFGALESGKSSDILLLDKNPLEDIINTQSISGVVKGHHYYSKAALSNMLEEVKASF